MIRSHYIAFLRHISAYTADLAYRMELGCSLKELARRAQARRCPFTDEVELIQRERAAEIAEAERNARTACAASDRIAADIDQANGKRSGIGRKRELLKLVRP